MEKEVVVVVDTGAPVVEPTMEEVAANGNVQPEVTPVKPEETKTTEGASPTPDPVTVEAAAQEAIDKRIGKITAEKYGYRREAEQLRVELEALRVAQDKPALPADAPQLEDYDYDDGKHQEALIQYQVNKALDTQQHIADQQRSEQARQNIANEFTNKEAEYANTHPEYIEEIANLPGFNPDTLDVIYDLGPQVSHYLAKHLDVANDIANASPTMAAVKLGQISMGLSADNKVVKPTTAPEPVVTLAGGAAITKSQDEMSMDEIMALPN